MIAQKAGRRNPIKKWAEDDSCYLVFPAFHPLNHDLNRWDIHVNNFTYIGRYGDSIMIESLPSTLQVSAVALDPVSTTKALLCGSPGEVSNIETYGDIFGVFTAGHTVNSNTIMEVCFLFLYENVT